MEHLPLLEHPGVAAAIIVIFAAVATICAVAVVALKLLELAS